MRVFRDDTSLSATPGLWPSIEKALGESRHLILLASPEAAASFWIAKEVDYWLTHRSPETLFIGLTDGELVWDREKGDFEWSAKTPLPKALKDCFTAEPRWIDLRAYRDGVDPRNARFIELSADFAAAIHGTLKEDLLSQEVRQQRRALTLAWTVAGVLLVLAGLAGWFGYTAEQRRRLAVANESRALVALSHRAELEMKPIEAVKLALASWPRDSNSDRPFLESALAAISTALAKQRLPRKLVTHTEPVRGAAWSSDESRILSWSWDGRVRLWDVQSGEQIESAMTHDDWLNGAAFSRDESRILSWSDDGTVRLWDATYPKGHLLDVACALLPDHQLTDVLQLHGMRSNESSMEPICTANKSIPMPSWDKIERDDVRAQKLK